MGKVIGTTKGDPLKPGHWSGIVSFIVVPMDEFEVLIWQDFMRKVKVVPIRLLDYLFIFSIQ